ncbi:MAG: glycosyltransferase family 4 protein [Candidatus Diapherotrites archaeon]|nr:glycosyltransferase family 4 protein [Candidatus Diapherotrites archaeon]
MKIAHVTHHFWPCIGGVESSIETLCIELMKKGHFCRVICLNRCGNSKDILSSREKHKRIEILRVPFLDLGIYKIAPKVIEYTKDVDVIHIHGIGFFSDFFLLTKIFHRKPVVISTHGGIFHTGKSLIKRIYFYLWCRAILRLAHKVVAVSENDLKIFREILPNSKVEYITVPFNLTGFKPGKKEKNTFIFVGRLSKNKNLPLLIEIFAKSSEKNNAMLYIAGGEFDEKIKVLKELVKRHGAEGRIKILGRCSDKKLKEILSRCDFFISASSHEGFGISTIEAMKAGCIPVLSKIPTFETFVDKGKNGYIIDFHDIELAVHRLSEIMSLEEDEKEVKRSNSIAYANLFDQSRVADKFDVLYSEVSKK